VVSHSGSYVGVKTATQICRTFYLTPFSALSCRSLFSKELKISEWFSSCPPSTFPPSRRDVPPQPFLSRHLVKRFFSFGISMVARRKGESRCRTFDLFDAVPLALRILRFPLTLIHPPCWVLDISVSSVFSSRSAVSRPAAFASRLSKFVERACFSEQSIAESNFASREAILIA